MKALDATRPISTMAAAAMTTSELSMGMAKGLGCRVHAAAIEGPMRSLQPVRNKACQGAEAAGLRAETFESSQAGGNEVLHIPATLLNANQVGERQLAAISLALAACAAAVLFVIEKVIGNLKCESQMRAELLQRGVLLLRGAGHERAESQRSQKQGARLAIVNRLEHFSRARRDAGSHVIALSADESRRAASRGQRGTAASRNIGWMNVAGQDFKGQRQQRVSG